MKKIKCIFLLFTLFCIISCSIPIKHQVNEQEGPKYHFHDIIVQKLRNYETVSIVVIGGKFIDYKNEDNDRFRSAYVTHRERDLLRVFGHVRSFKLIDRKNIGHYIEEIKLNQSGFISENDRIKIGEMTGATHIMIIEGTVDSTLGYNITTIHYRLIEVRTGRILSIDTESESLFKFI